MFKWFRKKNDDPESLPNSEVSEAEETAADLPEPDAGEAVPEAPAGVAAGQAESPEVAMIKELAAEFPEAAVIEELAGEIPQAAADEDFADEASDVAENEELAADDPEDVEDEAKPEVKRPGFFARLFGEKKGEESEETGSEAATADESEDVVPEEIASEVRETPVTEEVAEAAPETAVTEEVEEETLPAVVAEEIADEAPEELETEDYVDEPEAAQAAEAAEPVKGPGAETFPAEKDEDEDAAPRKGLFGKFKEKLSATRDKLAGRIETLLASVRTIDDDVLDELEELLITADMGTTTTTDLLFKIRGQVAGNELSDAEALKDALKKRIGEMMDVPLKPFPKAAPLVIMVVGINGVGKTTTIAKLTKRLQGEGKKVLLAAGDTFRSAAVEQLTIWAERLGADIVAQPTGSDPSAVVFDALSAARARGSDVVLIDTAGRLHTKVNLMDELKKIKRVAGKAMPGAPHHTILVLDGNTGQNALRQAQTFNEAVGVDSIIMTKLDGTAKGGVIVSIANELKIPITHVGLGESFDDLQPFDPEAFTEAILSAD